MARPLIYGIAGLARTGKDAVAEFILGAIGGYKYSFADPIRAMLVPLGIDMADPYWQAHKEDLIPAIGASPRQMMQTLGTEWGRNTINPELWLLMAKQRLLRTGPGMIIPDVRFNNEADWVRKHGGRIIHVSRPDAKEVNPHASENGVTIDLTTDASISNTGTLEELQTLVREMLHVIN